MHQERRSKSAIRTDQGGTQYKLQDLIDVEQFQILQDRLNEIHSFPSSIIDNDGNVLTATGWQDICMTFHRTNGPCEEECIKSGKYTLAHIHEATTAAIDRCPHGLAENATPIIIDGVHYGNFFTGQFFLEKPDLEFFRRQAEKYGFDEEMYLDAVRKVPIWTKEQLNSYLLFIQGLIEIISTSGLKRLREIESRKKIEETDERVSAVLSRMLDGFWTLDRHNGRITDVNDAMCQMLGYSREVLLRLSVADVEASLSPGQVRQRIEEVVENGSARFQSRHRRRDGTVIDVDVSAVYLPGNDLILGFHQDITERKRAEMALRESENRYKALVEHSADAIALIGADAKVIYEGPTVERITGYTAGERLGKSGFETIHPDDLPQVLDVFNKVIAHPGISQGAQFRASRKDGTFWWAEATATNLLHEPSVQAIVVNYHDITERKLAEEALAKSEERFQLAMEATQDGLWDWDIATSQIYYSPAYFKILGYEPSQFPANAATWSDLIHPEDRIRTLAINTDCIENRCDRFQVEFRMLAHDGTWKWILGKGKAVARDARGRALRLIGTHTDITERKEVEKALQDNEEKLRTVFNTMEEGMALNELIFDEQGTAIDYKILEVNKAYEDIVALSREEVVGKNATELYHMTADYITAFWQMHQQDEHAIKTDMFIPEINRWRHISTSKISGNRFATLFFDNTEQKNAEIALRESEERFRTLYETMAQGVVYHDASGRIISANPAAEHILGLSLDQMAGQTPLDPRWHAIHEDRSRFSGVADPGLTALRTGQPVKNMLMGVYHPQTSSYVWININSIPHFKPGEDKPYEVHTTFEDISARKRNEDIMRARLRLLEFASSHTVKELLQAALDEAGALVFSPIGFYHFVDPNQNTLTLQAWSTRTRLEFCTAAGEDSHYSLMDAGVWADGVREGRPIIHNDYASLSHKRGLPEGHATVNRELVVPVTRGGRIVAIMGVGNKPDDYNATDLEIVTALADFSWDIIQQLKTNNELRASEEQYRRLINLLPSGVVVHSEGRIELVNSAGNRIFGAAHPDELIGTSLMDRVHPDFHPLASQHIELSQEQGREAELIEEKLLRLDKTAFDAEVAAISVNYSGKPSTLAVFNEITERKQREHELQAIVTLSAALRTAPTRADMLPLIVHQAVDLLDCDSVAIEIIDMQTRDAVVEAANGAWKPLIGLRQKDATGLNSMISRAREPYVTQNVKQDLNLTHAAWAHNGIRACAGVPLVAQGQLIGFAWMGRATDISRSEVQLLSAVADIAANAIQRATLHEQTQRNAADLSLAYDRTLEGWAYTLELRDQETEGHTRRVTEKTLQLARRMSINEDDLENIRRGALLHDIGKMGIPDSVLLKAGTLNEREWEIMKRHPEYAYNLLARIEYLRPTLDIPYSHHEKWDGTGYPRGLKGEDIPLSARIFAIVDVWDALTSDRPYRLAWSRQDALEYIRQQSGRHFDPSVVEAFMEMMNESSPNDKKSLGAGAIE